jgi:hypothetical protein
VLCFRKREKYYLCSSVQSALSAPACRQRQVVIFFSKTPTFTAKSFICLKRLFLPALFIVSHLFIASAQHKNVSAEAEPLWASGHSYDPNNKSLDKHAEDGVINLLYDRCVNIAEQSEYKHFAIRIISQAGVQDNSEVSVAFDPLYQRLSFHKIKVIRNGQSLDKLNLKKLKVIQREEDRASYEYNGLQDAVNVLEDIRAGDIIDYSYTVKGWNPIFNGRYSSFFSTGFGVPVYNIFYKIICPQNRPLNIKYFNEKNQTVSAIAGANRVFEWSNTNIRPLKLQDKVPGWYDPYPQFMVSEYASWKEVNDWALKIYPKQVAASPALVKIIKNISNENKTTAGQIKAALRFVQDDIRYMAFEMGEHSHRPAAPSKVLSQRFGDCKEKSYLLCTMLRAMNIAADPVLINTTYKKTMAGWLPSPNNFDHMVLRAFNGKEWLYFDPTISYQRGDIEHIFFPDYQMALVICDTTTALTTLPFKNVNSVSVSNEFTAQAMYGEGSLKVTTINKGSFADDARYEFNRSSNSTILKDYQKFYAEYFPDIVADSLDYEDNDSTGEFVTIEYYTLPKFWVNSNDVLKVSVSPFVIESLLVTPKDKKRHMPVALKFPCNYKESIKVNLPEQWTIKEGELHIANKAFEYHFKITGMFNKAFVEAEYKNLSDYVDSMDAKKYLDDVESLLDNSTYDLTYKNGADKSGSDQTSSHKSSPLMPVFLVAAFIVGIIIWSQRVRR